MRNVDRRSFIRYCIYSAAALGLDQTVVGRLREAYAAGNGSLPTVLWLAAANCTGCTVSLANRIAADQPVDVGDLLINTIDLAYHPNLMGAAGELAVDTLNEASRGDYVLVVEGGIPTAFGGHTCTLWNENGQDVTALDAVTQLAPSAQAILAVGTCASFGGIPGGSPNPTGIRTVKQVTGYNTVNIPGCPTHPDWIIYTIATLLAGAPLPLDADSRPTALFSTRYTVHDKCPRRETEEAETFGVDGRCLEELGCKGPKTRADCPTRLWNGQTNWCIGANAICLGCTQKGFPDTFSPFYGEGEDDDEHDDEHGD